MYSLTECKSTWGSRWGSVKSMWGSMQGFGGGNTLDLDSEAQVINWRILLGLTPLTFLKLQFWHLKMGLKTPVLFILLSITKIIYFYILNKHKALNQVWKIPEDAPSRVSKTRQRTNAGIAIAWLRCFLISIPRVSFSTKVHILKATHFKC